MTALQYVGVYASTCMYVEVPYGISKSTQYLVGVKGCSMVGQRLLRGKFFVAQRTGNSASAGLFVGHQDESKSDHRHFQQMSGAYVHTSTGT